MKDAEQKIVSPSAETEEHKDTAGSDIEALKAIAEKYDMTVLEKKLMPPAMRLTTIFVTTGLMLLPSHFDR